MSNISKEAQERSVWKELGRAVNPKEQFRYWGFKDYREIYDAISKVDKDMREKALEEAPGTKDSIHEARMAFKRREFPKVVYYAMKVMDSIAGVFDEVEKLNEIRQTMLSRFYAGNAGKGGLSDEQLREMHEVLGKTPEEAAATSEPNKQTNAHIQSLLYTTAVPEPWEISKDAIVREAGPMQWLREQAPSWKGMKFDLIDSVFQNRAAKQKAAAKEALKIAEDSYKKIKDIFSKLEDNLGNFSEYVRIANEAKTSMDGFRDKLRGIYQENFADIVPDMSNFNEQADESGGVDVEGEPTKDQAQMPERNVPPTQPMEAAPAQEPEQLSLQFPQAPQQPSQQLSFDFTSGLELDDEYQFLQPVDDYGQPIEQQIAAAAERDVYRLIKRAQQVLDNGERGLAVALLVKASDICDHFNRDDQATDLLKTAQRISQE